MTRKPDNEPWRDFEDNLDPPPRDEWTPAEPPAAKALAFLMVAGALALIGSILALTIWMVTI